MWNPFKKVADEIESVPLRVSRKLIEQSIASHTLTKDVLLDYLSGALPKRGLIELAEFHANAVKRDRELLESLG